MKRFCTVLMLLMCSFTTQAQETTSDTTAPVYHEIDWVELIPQDDLDALMNPPGWLIEIEDGSSADDPRLLENRKQESEADARYRQALQSSAVRGDMAGRNIRLPGYVVPLTFDDEKRVIEFFLVPYMGACLHLPPPPPNQIVHITYEAGLAMDSLWDPYWIEGQLQLKEVSNFMGEAAYGIDVHNIEIYRF